MKPDFPRLYAQLELTPDCSLEEFKHAYRRLIAELHPDRQHADPAPAAHGMSLPDLNSIYAAALRFHRQHGRFPGGKLALPRRENTLGISMDIPTRAAPGPADNAQPSDARRGAALVLLLLVAALMVAVLVNFYSAEPAVATTQVAASTTAAVAPPQQPELLQPGMDMATVKAIQGPPLDMRGDEWDYGPSWLRFEKGRLVEWHSSPLRQLKVNSPSAPEIASLEK